MAVSGIEVARHSPFSGSEAAQLEAPERHGLREQMASGWANPCAVPVWHREHASLCYDGRPDVLLHSNRLWYSAALSIALPAHQRTALRGRTPA